MQEAGGIVVVGASAAYLEATADPKGAFYDFFQITVLEKLGQDELIACLRRLAQERGEEGRKVLNVLNCDPGRIRALHDLTGGNPRTLVLLYLLLELDAEGDVFSDLERLLDQVTVLYKSRVEDLAPQARVVLDAVALAWNPVTAADVAAATALETSAVSAQLDRLQKNGILEKVSLSSTARAGFQLGERFFNIWYLMRHGPRRQKNRLHWLTDFLRGFYSPAQLTERVLELLKDDNRQGLERGHYAMALAETVDNEDLRNLLAQEARAEFERFAIANGKRLEEIVDPEDLPTPSTAQEWFGMGRWLHVHLGRYDAAEAAYRHAIALDPNNAWPWDSLGNLLQDHLARYEEAESAYQRALDLKSSTSKIPQVNLFFLYYTQPERYEEAESLFETLVGRLPSRGAGLLCGFRALALDNFGEATQALAVALGGNQRALFMHYDDLLRVLRLAAARGYGDKLLAWLDEQGHADRYWPLRVAFNAYLHGEAKLMDVNPEVRGAAKRIYDWLDSARRARTAMAEETGKASSSKRKRIIRKSR
jgi:tetratricopeptide (TPR) repeat protein